MSRTISGTSSSPVVLAVAGDNPVTIASDALLQDGLYSSGSTVWTITNFGVVDAGMASVALALHSGGLLSNQSTGIIAGNNGVQITNAAGTVVNAGSIAGTAGIAVSLAAGGSVTNQASAHITASLHGVAIAGAAGTVTNAGVISVGSKAVYLYEGGKVTNLSGGTLSGFVGVKLATSAPGTVVNAGYIYGSNNGIYLRDGGVVTNQLGGTISSAARAIYVNGFGAATVTNAGFISGTVAAVRFTAGFADRLIVDPGASFSGSVYGGNSIGSSTVSTLELASGTAAGTLSGLGSEVLRFGDITIDSGATWTLSADTVGSGYSITDSGTLTNTGVLLSAITTSGVAVVTNAASATISAGGTAAVYLGTYGTLVNAGLLASTGTSTAASAVRATSGIQLVTNTSSGSLSGYGFGLDLAGDVETLSNAGRITASGTAGTGAFLGGGSPYVTNASGGTIAGAKYGLHLAAPAATLLNAGLLTASGTAGLGLADSSSGSYASNASSGTIAGYSFGADLSQTAETMVNAGLITASGTASVGLYLAAAGARLTNQSTGTIAGGARGVYLGQHDTLSNAGRISGTTAVSLYLSTLSNTGVVSGTTTGVYVLGTFASTVINAGTISGGTDAVSFHSGQAGRLVVEPGAVFTGTVDGGNSIGSSVASTLELASGTSAGTLSGLGGQYIDFAQITIDSSATWTLSADTLGSGYSITDSGTLTNTGTLGSSVTLASDAVLTNDASGLITSSGNAVIGPASGFALVVNLQDGTIAGSQGIYLPNGTIINDGSIGGTATGSGASGVHLQSGLVSNQSYGAITGYNGIYLGGTGGLTATLVNAGYVYGTTRYGVNTNYQSQNVTNLAAGTITGRDGGVYLKAATISNAGLIFGGTYYGIDLEGGFATNLSGGTVSGYTGVYLAGTATLANTGLVYGVTGVLASDQAGSVTNLSGGTIAGFAAGAFLHGATLSNAGLVRGSGHYGIAMQGGLATNLSSGTISGSTYGVRSRYAAATVATAGTISGGNDAVLLASGYANHLEVDPGAVFTGTVDGGNSIGSSVVSTLELVSGGSTGTLSGLGGEYIDFAQITIDSGASWLLTGSNTLATGITLSNAGTLTLSNATLNGAGTLVNDGRIVIDPSTLSIGGLSGSGTVTIGSSGSLNVDGTVAAGETIVFADNTGALSLTPAAGTFSGTIDDFGSGATITLDGVSDSTGISVVNSHTLEVTSSSLGTIDLALNPAQNLSGATFHAPVIGNNTVITADNLACFVAGTRIDTPFGPLPVDSLHVGDLVLTASGVARPVRWIGWRHMDPRRHPKPYRTQPIRVVANAIADGVPRRDVLLSPDHALLLDGMLVTVRQLLNGATVRQEDVPAVSYYHVELDTHDVLLAEGMPAESYLDTGNRDMFENAGLQLSLHPFMQNSQVRRVAESCAPFVDDDALVEPLWRRIAGRVRLLGRQMPAARVTSADPALHLRVGGRRIAPLCGPDGRYVFVLPNAEGELYLSSHHAQPNAERPWVSDDRQLGVMVRRITFRHGPELLAMPLDDPALTVGWWPMERQGDAASRWTDGHARLVLPSKGATVLQIELAGTLAYPRQGTQSRDTLAA